ncbi:tyrosine-type recombinase/integrase [Paraburkholderia panacisoli]|uniref:Tyrosine-type recombinase/integrase n=1 Tax=Paraburkholderia panacisoli TaxID=2603818 RepID=A0A5B0G3Z3_9BURK|nr:tyrosine-type recombinase/integrase [Paraburkholderia panacisoli]KAA0997408.1 tyrosine-type recombinase/integrase [Paraburkholderia panacisoli]
MTPIAPHITAFLQERLPLQRGASPNTCESYAYTFRLLFEYASDRLKVRPSKLNLEQIDARLVTDFLTHIEVTRHNGARTRNVRLAAIKSFLHFVEHRVPSALEQSLRIQAIPSKKADIPLISYLSLAEIQAILNAPDVRTRAGIRDRAMLHLCLSAGLRVSELTGLLLCAVNLQPIPMVRVMGKGRKERSLPLWKQAAADLRAWLAIRGNPPTPELFVNSRGEPMTRAGFAYLLRKYVQIAAKSCDSLRGKRVSPHVLRRTCAMMIFRATRDLRKVSLWLGHAQMQTTEIYLRADPTEKIEAIEAVPPLSLKRGRFSAADKLIASLRGVSL